MATPEQLMEGLPGAMASPMAAPAGPIPASSGVNWSGIQGLLADPNFKALVESLGAEDRHALEKYMTEQFGGTSGTLGGELAAGRMTPDEIIAVLTQSGFSLEQAQQIVASGNLNIPLITTPGRIAEQLGERGGVRQLAGPAAAMRGMVGQEVASQAALINARAQERALNLARLSGDGTGGGSRGGGGGGGSRGGGGGSRGGTAAGPKPPLKIPLPERAPWWASVLTPLLASGAKGLPEMLKSLTKGTKPEAGRTDRGNPWGVPSDFTREQLGQYALRSPAIGGERYGSTGPGEDYWKMLESQAQPEWAVPEAAGPAWESYRAGEREAYAPAPAPSPSLESPPEDYSWLYGEPEASYYDAGPASESAWYGWD